MKTVKNRLTKKQLFRLIVGALKQEKKDHKEEFDIKKMSSFAKRLSGLIYGFITNDDGVEKDETDNLPLSSPSKGDKKNDRT